MNITSQPLVSVVTPVYNTEKYLAECIESVVRQTYDNWEYVVVNNCSTDRSLEIASHYAEKDVRIRIHNNKEFLDLLPNWNHAMRQISPQSKYCKVVHADDCLFPGCIERMVEVAESHPSVGIVGAYRLEDDKVSLDGLPYPSTVTPGRNICRSRLLGGPYLFGSPSSLLIRSDLLRNRKNFYNEANLHADLEACFDILQDTDFGFVHQVLTFTRRHNETVTSFNRMFFTHIIGTLTVLEKYGHIFLDSSESKKALERYLTIYYRDLARTIFRLRKKEFRRRSKELWNFHRKAMKALGIPFRISKLLNSLFTVLAIHLLYKLKVE